METNKQNIMQIKLCHPCSISVFVTERYWNAKQENKRTWTTSETNENKLNF